VDIQNGEVLTSQILTIAGGIGPYMLAPAAPDPKTPPMLCLTFRDDGSQYFLTADARPGARLG
jgi:hypothetical protein